MVLGIMVSGINAKNIYIEILKCLYKKLLLAAMTLCFYGSEDFVIKVFKVKYFFASSIKKANYWNDVKV